MNQPAHTLETTQTISLFLLSIRGRLAPKTLDAARLVHNQTAGLPDNIAAARSLGDLSHMVYVPMQPANGGAGEFLVLDIWNSIEGLNKFFADPHVMEGGEQIFQSRDPVVWTPASGFERYNIPAPYGKNQRIVAIVRGQVESIAKARAIHNKAVSSALHMVRKAGNLSHEAYFRLAPPDSPQALEFLGLDVWMDHDGMHSVYESPQFLESMDGLFTAEPDFSVWQHPAGDWAEW